MSHFEILDFGIFQQFFVLRKLTCLVTLFDRKLQVFKNSPKWTIFGIFNEFLSTQNVNVARFARNVEWDIFYDFQTPWTVMFCFSLMSWFFSTFDFDLLCGISNPLALSNCGFWVYSLRSVSSWIMMGLTYVGLARTSSCNLDFLLIFRARTSKF